MDVTWPSPENLSQQAVVFHSLFCLGLYMGCYLEHEVKVSVTFYNRLLYNNHPEKINNMNLVQKDYTSQSERTATTLLPTLALSPLREQSKCIPGLLSSTGLQAILLGV